MLSGQLKKTINMFKNKKALFYLPMLQIVSDLAILIGTTGGFLKFILKLDFRKVIKNNFVLFFLTAIYLVSLLSVITSGIPGNDHPFLYQMDEWHQLQSVRYVFKSGTPNLAGAANGTMFHFFISGIMLLPFYMLKIVNPFAIKSAVDSLLEQHTLFIVLRIITLFFGVLSLITISKIAKRLKLSVFASVALFVFTPVWLSLSNFFKYDIALVFWITLALYFFIKYSKTISLKDFIFACMFSGFAFGVKVTGLTMFPLILLAFFFLTPKFYAKFKYLILGVFSFVFVSVFFALPDIIFGGRSMYMYLYDNIIGPGLVRPYFNIPYSFFQFNLVHKIPDIFGHAFYYFFLISFLIFIFLTYKDFEKRLFTELRLKLFLSFSFLIFCLTFIPLGIFITANRIIVLLPFMVIISLISLKYIFFVLRKSQMKIIVYLILIFLLFLQIFESYIWLSIKYLPSPQKISSEWVLQNIPKDSEIGLENIPIYQFEPDFILKEFYLKQYHPEIQTRFKYEVINSKSKINSEFIILSDVDYHLKYYNTSDKNDLVKKITKEGYKNVAYFPLKVPYYNYFDLNFDYPYLGLFAYPQSIRIYKKGEDIRK